MTNAYWFLFALVVVLIIRYGNLQRFMGTIRTATGSVRGATPANLWTRLTTDPWRWVVAIIAIGIMALILVPSGWRNFILGNSTFWVLLSAVVLYNIATGLLFPENAHARENARMVARIILAIVLIGQGWILVKDHLPGTPSMSGISQGISNAVGKISLPAATKWQVEKVVEAPVGKTVEVDLSVARNEWNVEGLFPLPQGKVEASSPDWKAPIIIGGKPGEGCSSLPGLGKTSKVRFRSLESEPVKIKVSGR